MVQMFFGNLTVTQLSLWNLKVHHRAHKRQLLYHTLRRLYSVRNYTPYFSQIH